MENFVEYFRGCTNTRLRRKNFFDFACKTYNGSNAILFLLIEAYRHSGRKRQATFINENYIVVKKSDDFIKNFPKYHLFLGDANIEDSRRESVVKETNRQIDLVGKNWIAKIKKQDNALDVFRSITRMQGTTQIRPDIFDKVQLDVADLLSQYLGPEPHILEFGIFNPDNSYQPNSEISTNLPTFRKMLKEGGFSGDEIGIY